MPTLAATQRTPTMDSTKLKSALKYSEVNSPVGDTFVRRKKRGPQRGANSKRRRRVKFCDEKMVEIFDDVVTHTNHAVDETHQSMHSLLLYNLGKSTVNSCWTYPQYGIYVGQEGEWEEVTWGVCNICMGLRNGVRNPNCGECAKTIFIEFLEFWSFQVRMDLVVVPDVSNKAQVIDMYNPFENTVKKVETGRYSTLAREEHGTYEVASRQRDVWCYAQLVAEAPLPVNSYLRDAKYGGAPASRRRSSISNCRNLIPNQAPLYETPYKGSEGIIFARKQPDMWSEYVDPDKYLEELMSFVEYPDNSDTEELFSLFERYRDLDHLMKRFNSPILNTKAYLRRFVHSRDVDTVMLFFTLLEAESRSFGPTVDNMRRILRAERKEKEAKMKAAKNKTLKKYQLDRQKRIDEGTLTRKSYPNGVYQMGLDSIQQFMTQQHVKETFPSRWRDYAEFLGDPEPIKRFEKKWNDWRDLYNSCFNAAIIGAMLTNNIQIVKSLMNHEIPPHLQIPDRDRNRGAGRIAYADIYFSRKRHKSRSCMAACQGHQGKLLQLIINMGHYTMIKFIIRQGVDINAISCCGQPTRLHWMERDFLASMYTYTTALSVAAYSATNGNGGTKIVKYLLKEGADPTVADNIALRSCINVIPSLESLEGLSKKDLKEKKSIQAGAVALRCVMNGIRETSQMDEAYCTMYLVHQAVIEKNWDTVHALLKRPKELLQKKGDRWGRMTFRKDAFVETLQFDIPSVAYSLGVIDMLIAEMELNQMVSYARNILGIVAMLEYNQFTIDAERFEALTTVTLKVLENNRPYDAFALLKLWQLEQYQHYLGLINKTQWKYREAADLLEDKPIRARNNRGTTKSSKVEKSENRGSMIRVKQKTLKQHKGVRTQEMLELLAGAAENGNVELFNCFYDHPGVKGIPISETIYSLLVKHSTCEGHVGMLEKILTDRVAHDSLIATTLMEDAFDEAVKMILDENFAFEAMEVVLRVATVETRRKMVEKHGAQTILRVLRYLFCFRRYRSEFLLKTLTEAVVDLNDKTVDYTGLVCEVLNTADSQADVFAKASKSKKESLPSRGGNKRQGGKSKRSSTGVDDGPNQFQFRIFGVEWFAGVHMFIELLLEHKVIDASRVVESWIPWKSFQHRPVRRKGYSLVPLFSQTISYDRVEKNPTKGTLAFLVDYREEIIDFIYFIVDFHSKPDWKSDMQSEMVEFEAKLDLWTDEEEIQIAFKKLQTNNESTSDDEESDENDDDDDDSESDDDDDNRFDLQLESGYVFLPNDEFDVDDDSVEFQQI